LRFLNDKNPDYKKAIEEMTIFSTEGKNMHDDAPDAITGLAEMLENGVKRKAVIMGSLF
jgi:hypothetical protein